MSLDMQRDVTNRCPVCGTSSIIVRHWEHPCRSESVCATCGEPYPFQREPRKFLVCYEVTVPAMKATLPGHSVEAVEALTVDAVLDIQDRLYQRTIETVPKSVSRAGATFIFRGIAPLEG